MYDCCLLEFGRPPERWRIHRESDREARLAAEELLLGSRAQAVELWDGNRLVFQTGGHCPESGPVDLKEPIPVL